MEKNFLSKQSFLLWKLLFAAIACFSVSNVNAELGIGAEFNIFVEQGLSSRYSQSQGKMAAGGNVSLTGYAVATKVSGPLSQPVLLVGGDLNLSNLGIRTGSIIASGDVSAASRSVIKGLPAGASLQSDVPLPFNINEEFNSLRAQSSTLSIAKETGFVQYLYGGVRLMGDCVSQTQVFNIDGQILHNSNHFVVACIPPNATIVFNVNGISGVGFKNIGLHALNTWSSRLIWNFYEATELSLANVEVIGLLLAPSAQVNTTWGAVRGTVLAQSWSGSFALKQNLFAGDLSSILLQTPPDSDSDGVEDEFDQCPDTPEGENVNILGCSLTQLDSDNDTVNDALDVCPETPLGEAVNDEGCSLDQIDSDEDGVPDHLDLFPFDPTETTDLDGDGIGDNSDADVDGDGVENDQDVFPLDVAESADLDGDGIGDNADIDRDGDGVENDQDLFPSDPNETTDLDGDGVGDNSDTDIDGDGIGNAVDAFPRDATEVSDLDGDGIGDNSDNDRDGDGVNNDLDLFPSDASEISDLDGDGIGDNSDADVDGDGVDNVLDAFPFDATESADLDGDGIGDNADMDTDGDGVINDVDLFPLDPNETSDLDRDSIGDNADTDRDGDGVDNDQDAFPDDVNESSDLDGDNIGDNFDADVDGDGVENELDVFPTDPTESKDLDNDGVGDNSDTDRDGDGVDNELDLFPDEETENSDLDGDGIGDNSDTDRDGDGVININDAFPEDITESSDLDGDGIGDNADTDRDGDGVDNEQDVFPEDALETSDLDDDGVGNNADTDRDGDGVDNERDIFPEDASETSDLDGDGTGDNADTDRDGDGVDNEQDAFPGDATESSDLDGDGTGDNTDTDVDGDGVDNEVDDFPLDQSQSSVNVSLDITTPENGLVTTQGQIEVTGTLDGAFNSIEIAGVPAQITDGQFTGLINLHDGMNRLTVVGIYTTPSGDEAITATTSVIFDTSAPEIILSSVFDGMVTTESQITVAGSLEDLRSNISGLDEASVSINGIEVEVINRSFELGEYLLQPGLNAINVVATDAVGNANLVTVTVNHLSNAGQRIEEIRGNNQLSNIGTTLSEPLVVRLVDRNNVPIVGRAVTFEVFSGDGLVTDLPRSGRALTVISNDQGFAEVDFQLGQRSGAGLHQVIARSIGFPGQVIFCASAQALTPNTISATRGSYQRSLGGALLPEPIVAKVVDSSANPVQGVDVLFEIERGDSLFIDEDGVEVEQLILSTDVDGNATIDLRLGDSPKYLQTNDHLIRASLVGSSELNTSYALTSFISGPIEQTSVSGIVLDNSNLPLPNVAVALSGASFSTLQTVTDEQGQFVFEQAPVGTVHLGFDASTTTAVGDFPTLGFDFVTVSGRDNTIGMPVYIPRLDTQGGKLAGGNQQVVIPLAGVEGAEVIIAPNSVTLPDGSSEGIIMFSQVQTDKTPMPAPDGVSFDVAWTLQPSGTKFDPPARVTLPNTSAGIPGQEYDMVTFDHDLGEWVSMGAGVVSEDGATVTSKLGFGIREAGWGGLCPPPDDTCNINCDDGNECTDDSKSDCSCSNEIVPERVNPNQTEGNCQRELCSGSEDDDSDEPTDGCQLCMNGMPVDKNIDAVTAKHDANDTDATILLGSEFIYLVDEPNNDCDTLEYEWDFKDGGATSSSQSGTYLFSQEGVYDVEVEVSCAECTDASKSVTDNIKITVVKVELVTPHGDPVAAPVSSGRGQNEYTFSAAAAGVLTINFEASVTPNSGDLNQIRDKVIFSVDNVGSAPVWNAANPGGRASVSGSSLIAEARFNGLPASNNDFGTKSAQLTLDGNLEESVDIEVFYPRDVLNATGGANPNWFHYWRQVHVNANVIYDPTHGNSAFVPGILNWSYAAPVSKTQIVVGRSHPGNFQSYSGAGRLYSGIDRYIATVVHEEKHIQQISNADALMPPSNGNDSFRYGWSWNQPTHNHWQHGADGQWGRATIDDDGNAVVDDASPLPPFEPGAGDDITLDHPVWFWWPNVWPLPVPNAGPHPIESDAINHSNNFLNEHDFSAQDWGDPGKQHNTLNRWND